MTTSSHTLAAPAITPSAPAPVCLLYTMLRHGRGLSHEEASRSTNDTIGEALDRIPSQAY